MIDLRDVDRLRDLTRRIAVRLCTVYNAKRLFWFSGTGEWVEHLANGIVRRYVGEGDLQESETSLEGLRKQTSLKEKTTMTSYTTLRVAATLLVVTIHWSLAGTTQAETQKTFHVAPSGSDENPGSEAKPFKTIQRARDEVRKVNQTMTGDIEVILHGGTHPLSETLVFDQRDNGTGGHNVVYKAAVGAAPVLSGGKRITGWKADANGRWKAVCGEHFRQLYVNGKRAVRARSPEAKAEKAREWYDLGMATVPGMELFGENGYRTTDVAMADWRNPGDVEFCYYVGWCHTRCKVDSIVRDGAHAVVRMVQPHFMLARRKEGLRAELPNYVENALELLDEPGEWYLDRSAKLLYYKPRPGEKMNEVEVVAPVLEKTRRAARAVGQAGRTSSVPRTHLRPMPRGCGRVGSGWRTCRPISSNTCSIGLSDPARLTTCIMRT